MRKWLGGIVFYGVIACFSIWIAWMATDNQIPIVYYGEGASLEPNPAHAGDQMLLHWPIKVNRVCPGTVLRSIKDAATGKTVVSFDRSPSAASVEMGDTVLNKSFGMPSTGLPESLIYSAEVCFECNLLQRVFPLCTRTPEVPFRFAH